MRLYKQMLALQKENLISFHVPGHKSHPLMLSYFKAFDDILKLDVTEIPGTDDLHEPEACIFNSQNKARDFYGSLNSYFLINGTTCGIYAMIMAVTQPGDELIIQRDCHKAVYEALFLARVKGLSIAPEIIESINIPLGLTLESVEDAFNKNPKAKGIVLTYPNYYGIACDLKSIVDYVHRLNKVVLVDAAHGAHLTLNKALPLCPIKCGADIIVQSSHKSLPVMTQTSLLHLNSKNIDENKLKRMIRLHQSSSPSYVLMTSLDIGLTIIEEQGIELMKALLGNIKDFYLSQSFCFLKQEDLPVGFYLDQTKLVFKGVSNHKDPSDLEEQLRKNGIQLEFSNKNVAVFVSSIMNTSEDFQDLAKKMESIELKCYSGNENKGLNLEIPIVMSLTDAYYKDSEIVLLREAIHKVSKDYIIPYPPGIPLVIPGEQITEELVEKIEMLTNQHQKIIGLYKHSNNVIKIEVIKTEDSHEKRAARMD